MSDDGAHALTAIAFLGSVFSPYYAAARRGAGQPPDPLGHCSLNMALYGGRRRWTMTERRAHRVARSPERLAIGPSAIAWHGPVLELTVDEVAAPWPRRVRGTVRITPLVPPGPAVALDADGLHLWRPVAAAARIEVRLTHPALAWSGHAYLDTNLGQVPLEQSFADWTWSRAALPDGRTAVLYDIRRSDGTEFALARAFDAAGGHEDFDPPAPARLPATRWGIPRWTRADVNASRDPRVSATLESGPFYARSLLETRLLGQDALAVHESLSLERFGARWVQALLPFRMPRVPW